MSLLLSYTLVSSVLDFSQMVLAVQKHLSMANKSYLTTPVNATFPKNQSLGMSLLLPYTLMSLVLDFSQMVLAVWKHLKMAIIIIPNNPCYKNFPKKLITWHVLALALHLGVFGAGLHPDGPGCRETP